MTNLIFISLLAHDKFNTIALVILSQHPAIFYSVWSPLTRNLRCWIPLFRAAHAETERRHRLSSMAARRTLDAQDSVSIRTVLNQRRHILAANGTRRLAIPYGKATHFRPSKPVQLGRRARLLHTCLWNSLPFRHPGDRSHFKYKSPHTMIFPLDPDRWSN